MGSTTLAQPARPDYRENLASLTRAQKPSRGTAAYSRHINRPAGRRVAAAAHLIGMSPNQATAVSACLSAAALLLLATGPATVWTGIAIATLLASGYVMDSVDGQLARLRGGGSVAGEWLDHTVDCAKTSALHLAVLVAWHRNPPVDGDQVLLVPIAFEIVDVVCFFGIIMLPFLRAQHVPAAGARTASPTATPPEGPWRRWLILPSDYGVFCWVFVLLGWPVLFLSAYTLLFALNAVLLALALRKWWRELNALTA